MTDYKEMYLKMFGATEDAINLLIAAHRECEALYMSQTESQAQAEGQPPEEKQA